MSKTRLTITLSQPILDKVDRLIDKVNIRNRSHAIEHLLEKSLKTRIETLVILAGDKDEYGDVVRPLTALNNKPLILYTIEHFKRFGVTNIIIATNIKGKKIESVIGTGEKLGIQIHYMYEDTPLGTAGAIQHASQGLGRNPFYVISGDVLTNVDLDDMAAFHSQYQGLVTMAVKPRNTKQSYDNVFIQGHTVVDFQKSQQHQTVGIVNAGVYIFEPEALTFFPKKIPASLERDVFPKMAQSGNLLAFSFQGIWFDITADTNYQQALDTWK